MDQKYWCYILHNTDEQYKNRSYVGYTVNFKRRIRQHNKEIIGGARSTSSCAGTWAFAMLMTGFQTSNNALSCEFKLKHPDGRRRKNKKYCGIEGRILTLNEVLNAPRWSEKCTIENKDCQYTVYVIKEIYDKLDLGKFPDNIKIVCGINLDEKVETPIS